MAVAKIKLATALKLKNAGQAPTRTESLGTLDEEMRGQVTAAILHLGEAAEANARVLERQIDLSTEMMATVAKEARRLSGMRSAIYGVSGILSRTELATPISVNTSP